MNHEIRLRNIIGILRGNSSDELRAASILDYIDRYYEERWVPTEEDMEKMFQASLELIRESTEESIHTGDSI